MFAAPQEVMAGATAGITLWALCLLPALLPFFIISDLLVEQGAVDFLGALCEPFMRPLFRLPGCAGFVLAIVHTAGMPIGAVLTSRLRESGQLSRIQGERLLAFSCNPSPGFMFGAVAGGMLGAPALGIVLAGSVYTANLIVGFLFRFYGGRDMDSVKGDGSRRRAPFSHAAQKLRVAQKSGRHLGVVFAESIKKNVSTLLQIGGYIVFFSVLVRLLQHFSILTFFSQIPSKILEFFHKALPGVTRGCEAILTGIIEQTLGCRAAADAMPTLALQAGAIAFLMGFGGLCVFAQVAGITAKTDLRLKPFLAARLLHGFLALVLSQIALRHLHLTATAPLWSNEWQAGASGHSLYHYMAQGWVMFKWNLLFCSALILFILILSFKHARKT
jgi:sporulation integral membrane protein YlbJ